MSAEQKTTQEQCCAPSEGVPFSAMMEKMMGQQGQGCGCSEMMSQMMEQPGETCPCTDMIPKGTDQVETNSECSSTMSQLMGARCGPQVETGTGTQTA
jgi:hypothetical protein